MSVTTYAGCSCCGQSGSGAGSGSGSGGSGSGDGLLYPTCESCFGPGGRLSYPTTVVVTFTDLGLSTDPLTNEGGPSFVGPPPDDPQFADVASITVSLCIDGPTGPWQVVIGGGPGNGDYAFVMTNCNPLVLEGTIPPYGAVVVTE